MHRHFDDTGVSLFVFNKDGSVSATNEHIKFYFPSTQNEDWFWHYAVPTAYIYDGIYVGCFKNHEDFSNGILGIVYRNFNDLKFGVYSYR